MQRQPLLAAQRERIAAGLPFVESLARRVASSMPHSIELGDLVQDGMLGLIDAACRFDEARGIKFETFAERRVRGAMIDALRRDAWPRGVRRQRRELEAAREELRRELGAEPSLADLAARIGSDEARLGRTIVRINTIESTSPLSAGDNVDGSTLPAALVPSEPPAPDRAFEEREVRDRIRAAIASLPPRERKVIAMYYYREATMKQIGAEIGVNESRVSQLHARAVQRLRKALGADCSAEEAARALRPAILQFQQAMRRMQMAKMQEPAVKPDAPGVVLPYRASSAQKPKAAGRRRVPASPARVAAAR
jgi:RNA polymerase sigma factor for flagellar operon FliA